MSDEFRPECEDDIQSIINMTNDYARKSGHKLLTKDEEKSIRLQHYRNVDNNKILHERAVEAEKRRAEIREKGAEMLFKRFGISGFVDWNKGLQDIHKDAYRSVFDEIRQLIQMEENC